jgi:hypothetical protein
MDSRLLRQWDELSVADDAIATMQSEITRLQAHLIAMKKARNNLTSLFQLPVEIIQQILLYAISLTSDHLRDPNRQNLYHFGYDTNWERVMLVCIRFHEISLGTPELWAYVDFSWPIERITRHVARAGAFGFIIGNNKTNPTKHRVIASTCFMNARSAYVSLIRHFGNESHFEDTNRIMHQPAPNLLTLHLDMGGPYESSLDLLDLYPALTELSIMHAWITNPINAHLSRLTRFHVGSTKMSARALLGLLQHTTCLTALLLLNVDTAYDLGNDLQAIDHSIALSHLRKLAISDSDTVLVSSLLMALSTHTPMLEEMQVETRLSDLHECHHELVANIVQEVATRWKSMSSVPLPLAKWIWRPNEDCCSWIDIRTPSHITPSLKALIYYEQTLESLYLEHDMHINSIQVERLRRKQGKSFWTTKVDYMIGQHVSIKELTFFLCRPKVIGVTEWVKKHQENGQDIGKVTFVSSESGKDYKALLKSGLVQQVEEVIRVYHNA